MNTEGRPEETKRQASAPQVVEPAPGRYTEGYNAAMAIMMGRLNAALADASEAKQANLSAQVELAELKRTQASAPSAQVVPDGWKLVPLKPTPEMWRVWDQAPFNEDGDIERNNAWGAMLAAAPEALPAAQQPAVEPVDRTFALMLLSEASKSGHLGTMKLAAQLAGVPACEGCGYVVQHCRCASPAAQPAVEPVAREWHFEGVPPAGSTCLVWARSSFAKGPFYTVDNYGEQHEAPVSFSSATIPVGESWDSFDHEDVLAWSLLDEAGPLASPTAQPAEGQKP